CRPWCIKAVMKRERDNKLPLHLPIIELGHLNAFKIWLLLNLGFNSVIMELYERELLPELVKWLDRREILAIKGPRQPGKTTLLEMLSTVLDYRGKILLPPG
ncbi:MAG: hypothetical protein WBE22_08985, partial [Halobacteriota archaeon]